MESEYILESTLRATIDFNFKNYKISAFSGKQASESGWTEHLPYHCHIFYSGNELRVVLGEKIFEMDKKKIPKDLTKDLIKNKKSINQKIKEVFHTGKVHNFPNINF